MSNLILSNIGLLVTMDDERSELSGVNIVIRDGIIDQIGVSSNPTQIDGTRTVDMSGYAVFPGLINTHHHLYQTLTRAVPGAQNTGLFEWLRTLYPIWGKMDGEAVYVSALVGLAELLLSGCTSSADHLYMYPNGARLDDSIRAATKLGIRFHPTRGSMSFGESAGGLPPDSLVENETHILADCQRLIEEFHDPEVGSMVQIGLAPCSPFSVSSDLMVETASMARSYGVRLHTHLAETKDEEEFCLEKFGKRPLEYVMDLGWNDGDVWFAHMVHCCNKDIETLASNGMAIAHCPTSNMRLASGIAPIMQMLNAGVDVGVGVDGSASNDGGHMLGEVRQAMLLARLAGVLEEGERNIGASNQYFTARQALEIGTVGGAAALGREDIGQIQVGKCGDIFAVKMDKLHYAGGLSDPGAAVLMCASHNVDLVVVNGNVVVEDGMLCTLDINNVVERHNRISKELVS